MRKRSAPLGVLCSLVSVLSAQEPASRPAPRDWTTPGELFKDALEWRSIGPYRGGRCAAVTGVPALPRVHWFGGTGGGVWKTVDAGASWQNVSDGFFGGSIGAVAVSESDPNVVYAGGGEKTVRGNVSHGSGAWRSTDAGRTWTAIGLEDSHHIPRIRIHPKNPDLAYAAVLGHLFGPSPMRGVYRTKDGGRNWERVLHVNDDAGAVDLVLDPGNPRTLYATLWRVRRLPYGLESGGAGSGLWKSTDGGDTWKELSQNPGLPKGTLGIIGVAVSPVNGDRIYAIVEAEEGGVFRSDDAGLKWTRVNSDRSLRQRAWYYTRVYADPRAIDTIYVLNVAVHRSQDGGKTFTSVATPHGDNHDLWIAPDDPLHMIEGNDGGATVTFDGGKTWSSLDNQPTAQFYRVTTDRRFPYRIYGAQQDNSAVRIASRSSRGGIGVRDWEPTAGGESGHIVAHPANPDVAFGGSYGGYMVRLDHRTNEMRNVSPWPENPMGAGAADLKYRFQWNFPIFFSPHEPFALYAAANVLFRSRDEGQSWEVISPDLTRNDRSKMGPSGGPITKDNTSVEYYGTIFAAAESPHEAGVLWTGSDDGLVQLSRDAGQTWTDVTPKDLPPWSMINSLEVHPFEKGGLYLAATRYKSDDFAPYLYRTTDFGKTWTRIVGGIPPQQFTRVVRADPKRRGLLYAGTERGVYVSLDDGARWSPLQLDLPIVPITDLAVKEDDLVAATQGRSFWVLDDLTPLHQLGADVVAGDAHLFRPRPAYRVPGGGGGGGARGVGENPPAGAVIWFWLREVAKEPATLEILDEDGKLVRKFTSKAADEGEAKEAKEAREAQEEDEDGGRERGGERLTVRNGVNRFVWNLRHSGAKKVPGMVLWGGGLDGPIAAPGRYRVRLCAGGKTLEAPFEVKADPRSSATPEDFRAQLGFLIEVRDKITETHEAILRIRDLREQTKGMSKRLADRSDLKEVTDAAAELDRELTSIEEALYQTKSKSSQDPLHFPIRLNNKLSALAGEVGTGDKRPTQQALALRQEITVRIDAELARLKELEARELVRLNELAKERGVPVVIPKWVAAPGGEK